MIYGLGECGALYPLEDVMHDIHSPSILSRAGPCMRSLHTQGHPCWAGISIPPFVLPLCGAGLAGQG